MLERGPVPFANFPVFHPRLPLIKRPSSFESFKPQPHIASDFREEQFHQLDCRWASAPWTHSAAPGYARQRVSDYQL